MSIAKRVLALAAAGATALVLGGVLSTAHQATRVDAAGPTFGAIGCSNGTLATGSIIIGTTTGTGLNSSAGQGIVFPTTGTPSVLTGGGQVGTGLAGGLSAPGALSITAPANVVECGAVFQDTTTGGATGTATDADPNTIDGGTITYTLTGGAGFTQILESNSTSAGVNCGSAQPPTTTAGATAGASVQTVTVTGATGGTFTLSFGGATTGTIPFNATPAQVQTALSALAPITTAGGVTVTQPGGVGTPFIITFTNTGAQAPITASSTGLTPATIAAPTVATTITTTGGAGVSQQQDFLVTGTGGTFTLTFNNETTPALPFNATAAQIATALNGLATLAPAPAGAGPVTTAGGPVNVTPVTVTFTPAGAKAPIVAGGFTGVPGGTATASITTVGGGAGTGTITAAGGLESCQGAVTNGTLGVSPSPGNVIHVGFRPGATFGFFGAGSSLASSPITLSATYNRFPALNAAGAGPSTLTVSTSIGLPIPIYSLVLSASPTTVAAASGSGAGSTITASLFRATTSSCIPIANLGITSGFVVCSAATVNQLLPGATIFTAGAEPGVITFTTSDGVFGGSGTGGVSGSFGGQVVSIQCGAVPGASPILTVPSLFAPAIGSGLGSPFFFSTNSCVSATATLFGGGSAGTALVSAQFVGDFTGATAFSSTTVNLSPTAATVSLSRGCNEVIVPASLATAGTTTVTGAALSGAVTPAGNVVSIFQYNNSAKAFQALFFNTAGAPTDISSVAVGSSVFICVSGSGTIAAS